MRLKTFIAKAAESLIWRRPNFPEASYSMHVNKITFVHFSKHTSIVQQLHIICAVMQRKTEILQRLHNL